MSSFRDVNAFLCGKMHCERTPSTHIKYYLPPKLRRALPLVIPMQLQQRKREVEPHIIRQIAGVFGVPQSTLTDAFKCNYGDVALYACLLVNQLERLIFSAERDPVVFGKLLEGFCTSVSIFINAIKSTCRTDSRHRLDPQLLRSVTTRLEALSEHPLSSAPGSTRAALKQACGLLAGFLRERQN